MRWPYCHFPQPRDALDVARSICNSIDHLGALSATFPVPTIYQRGILSNISCLTAKKKKCIQKPRFTSRKKIPVPVLPPLACRSLYLHPSALFVFIYLLSGFSFVFFSIVTVPRHPHQSILTPLPRVV